MRKETYFRDCFLPKHLEEQIFRCLILCFLWSRPFFRGGKSDSAKYFGVLLIWRSILAFFKLPMSHKNYFLVDVLFNVCSIALVLDGSSLPWLRKKQCNVWFTVEGIEGRSHHHLSKAGRSWELVGPCQAGVTFSAHLPVCNLPPIEFSPFRWAPAFLSPKFTWFRYLKPWEKRNFGGLPEGVRQEATSDRACCLTQL